MITKQQKKLAKNLGEPIVSRHAAIERRSWEPWSDKENQLFFDALSRNSRNWAEIAKEIGTKRQEQVRTYYYRVLRKVSKILSTVHYNLDNRDRVATLVAMLAYWSTRQETTLDETSAEFAQFCKDRLMTQKVAAVEVSRPVAAPVASAPAAVAAARPRSMPVPEKVIIQLVPASEDVASQLAEAGFNPRLQLTFKSKRPISAIVEHVTKKWVDSLGESVAPNPIRLSPLGRSQDSGASWGIDDVEVSILSVYQTLGAPPAIKLEYSWVDSHAMFSAAPNNNNNYMSLNNMNVVESVSTSPSVSHDDIPSHSPIFESDPQNQFMHPLSYNYEPSTAHTSIFEMDPVEQQMRVMNIVADPFDETGSHSADFADMHFEPMTNDDEDELLAYPEDDSASEALMSSAPSQPRIIFKANNNALKSSQELSQMNQRSAMLHSSTTLVPIVRAATPSPFPVALNMSYGANGIINADTFTTYDMDNDPQYGLNFTAATSRMYMPNSMLDPVASSPTDDSTFFGSPGLSQSPMRPKAMKQHERPAMEGSDADDDDYASAYKHYHTSKRARTSDIDFL